MIYTFIERKFTMSHTFARRRQHIRAPRIFKTLERYRVNDK